MLTFLLDNIGTIVVLLIVVAVVAAIIISHFRAKKKGIDTPVSPSTISLREGCTSGISNPGINVIRIRFMAGTHPRSSRKRSNEYSLVTNGARKGT